MKPWRWTFLLLLLLSACSQQVQRQTQRRGGSVTGLRPGPWASIDQVPVPELSEFEPRLPERIVFPNGVTLLLLQDSSRPIIELELRMRTGSWNDPRDLTGMSEMVAEVIRSGGSESWPGDRLDEELGALGADVSFTAKRDSTEASFECLASDFDHVLSIFQTLVQSPTFPEDKVELVRGQLLAALTARNNRAGEAASRESMRAYYGVGDPRVRRQEAHTIENIGVVDLKNFHATQYGSRRALLTLFGDFEKEKSVATLEKVFGNWPGQTAQAAKLPIVAPLAEKSQVFLAHKKGGNQTEIRLLHHGVRRSHPDYPALHLGSWILGVGGFGNRMMTRIRRELGLAYGAGAAWTGSFEQQGLFQSWCATKNETTALAIREMVLVMNAFLEEGVPSREFEEARSRLLNAGVFDVDTPAEVLSRTADLEFYGYPWNFYEQVSSSIRSLSPEETIAACRRHLNPQNISVFVLGDSSAFDSDLSEFGSVTPWALEVSKEEPSVEAESNETAQAQKLVRHLLASHGGVEAWLETTAIWCRIQAPELGPFEVWLQYPSRSRLTNPEGENHFVETFVDGSGWTIQSGKPTEIWDSSKITTHENLLSKKLPFVLMRLARSEYKLRSPREELLILSFEGTEISMIVGKDGLCEKLFLEDGSYRFEDYGLVGSLMLPKRSIWTPKDQPEVKFQLEWITNPEILPLWFEQPGE